MKRYIIEFNKENLSSYTPRTLYVPVGEKIQLLFKVEQETTNQTLATISVNGVSKSKDEDAVTFKVPNTETSYTVSSFTFDDGFVNNSNITGSITYDTNKTLAFTSVFVEPVEPESVSYVEVSGGGDIPTDIACESVTCTESMTNGSTVVSGFGMDLKGSDDNTVVSIYNDSTYGGTITVGTNDANVAITDKNIIVNKGESGVADISIDSFTGDVSVTDGMNTSYMNASSLTTGTVTCDAFMLGATELSEGQLEQLLQLLQS